MTVICLVLTLPGSKNFINVCHWALSWGNSIQFISSQLIFIVFTVTLNLSPSSWHSKWLHYKRWLYSDTNLCIPHWTPLHAGDLGPMPHQACHWCLQTLCVPYVGMFITGATGQVEPIRTEAWFNIERGALVSDECCNWTQEINYVVCFS
jgi:hypothetical protein